MPKLINNDNFQAIFYTETIENKVSEIKAFPLYIKYAVKSADNITIALELERAENLNEYIDYLNKNSDLYSKIVLKVADYDAVKIKG